ncbi:MAG: ATP-grasp domain-containing protein [Planctomycetes bacterium]|nr:ATP-grasp domain-containing protein [Planctomycetota bacterium]
MDGTPVIIIGASARAAAMSACRAGWTPWCADLFADADLQRIAQARKVPIESYPEGLLDALAEMPAAPVIYTGALENRPDLVAKIERPLWGNPPEVLRAVRSPQRWTQCLHEHGIPCPPISFAPTTAGRWLTKPLKSAAGYGIQPYAGQPFNPRTHFLQEWIDGASCSAIYLGRDDDTLLLGVTRQLIGTPWLNATGYHYAGSIGPLALEPALEQRWREFGIDLARTFRVRGLFGVDAIVRDGVPWPVEINPRYTASVEVLERAMQTPFLPLHRSAFDARGAGGSPAQVVPAIHGKAILYARKTFAFPNAGPWQAALKGDVDPDGAAYADIPPAGDIIEHGRPVLTLFASGPTVDEVMTKLREKAEALARRFGG